MSPLQNPHGTSMAAIRAYFKRAEPAPESPRVRDLTMCPTCGRGMSRHEYLEADRKRVPLCEARNGHLANALRYHEGAHPVSAFTDALRAERARRDREGWRDGKPTPLLDVQGAAARPVAR